VFVFIITLRAQKNCQPSRISTMLRAFRQESFSSAIYTTVDHVHNTCRNRDR